MAPFAVENAGEALDRQKAGWVPGTELNLPASFMAAFLSPGPTPLAPSASLPIPTPALAPRPDAALADAILRYAEDNKVDYNMAKSVLARRQPQLFAAYWDGRKTIQAGRAH